MTRSGRLPLLALLVATLGGGLDAQAQGDCVNFTEYPFGVAITPDALGAITTIATCSFEAEYSHVTGIVADATYQFTLSSGNYITVRQGTFDGPVIAQGYSPVLATAVDAGDIYPHWSVDETCATATGTCIVTTVQMFLNCTPPTVSATVVEDCEQQTFIIEVDVASTGDSSVVNIVYDLDGNVQTVAGVGVGVTVLGPFFFGDNVDVTVEHETDPVCNRAFGLLTESGDCPVLIPCGLNPATFNYCYANDEDQVWNYASQGGSGSLVLTFTGGTIESSGNDQLIIYDGPDASGNVLFQHTTFATLDLTGLTVVSTTGAFHMVLSTNAFTSCSDGSLDSWAWQVQCLNCVLPQASAASVDDCPNNQFSIPVDISGVGDGAAVTIAYTVNGGAQQFVSGVTVGQVVLGPFTVNDIVFISIQHEFDATCNIDLGSFTDQGTCPNLIVCGAPAIVENYCYEPSDAHSWSYTNVGSGTLRLTFIRGTIESNTWDHLRIYDGTDASGTLVFDHTTFQTYNLGPEGSAINGTFYPYYGLQIYSTTGSIFMAMTSDGSVQCGGPFPATDFDSWEWDVVCLDCTIPTAVVTVVDDCANNLFSLSTDITSTGDGATATLDYTVNGGALQSVSGLGLGETVLGPFTFGDIVNLVLAHESNSLCNIPFGDFSETGTCPQLLDCTVPVDSSVCFGNNNDLRYYYQGTGTYPLAIFFNAGQINFGDQIFVYDGGDITAPLIYSGNNAGDLTGLFFFTTNPEHRLCFRILSDGFTSCEDGGFTVPIDWTVNCLDCVPPTATFSIAQDCENFQYFVDVVVDSLGSDPEMEITNDAGVVPTTITAAGTYQVGPFVSGVPVQITVVNDANSLCNIYSGSLVNPLCPTILCGGTPLPQTYCYINGDDHAWAYEAPTVGGTIHMIFQRGTIETNIFDNLNIYDGTDATGPVLFTHGASSVNLGPVGSAINSPDFGYETIDVTTTTGNLYMTLTSDGSVSCSDNVGFYDEWEFTVQCVGCAAPGIAYNTVADCRHRIYKTEVIVTQAPGPLGLRIVESIGADTLNVTAVGVYEFGPFPVNSPAVFGVTDLESPNCTFFSDTLTYSSDSCVIRSCGFDYYTYCYENNEDRWYTFKSLENVPTTVSFTQGQLLSNDRIVLYNGYDETAAVIYQGSNGGNLTGFEVNSQNPDNAITLRIQSNDAGSCDDGQATAGMNWVVGCGAVGMDELSSDGFSVYPNPTQGNLFVELGNKVLGNVRLRVMDMSGRVVLDDPFTVQAGGRRTVDMRGLQAGQYMVQLTTSKWVKTQRVQVER